MRRIWISLLIASIFAFGASAREPINGLGEFKLGQTTTEDLDGLLKKGIISNKVKLEQDRVISPICSKSEHINIGDLSVAGIKIRNCKAVFFKEQLSLIDCADSSIDLYKALSLKYRAPISKTSFLPGQCSAANDSNFDNIWLDPNTNNSIVLEYGVRYTKDCVRKERSKISLKSNKLFSEIVQCSKEEDAAKTREKLDLNQL